MAVTGTRERVLTAALSSFVDEGYEAATIARIRERSGVSNGALFHHFPSKEAIADALYLDAMASFQQGLWAVVQRKPRSLRAAVRDVITHQLSWIEENPDLARFVYLRGHLDWDTPSGADMASLNRDLAAAFQEWMSPFVAAGEIRPMSMLMVTAIVTGPGHAIAQRWLAGQLDAPATAFAGELTDAAYAALRGTPIDARQSRRPAPPRQGHIDLQLITDDGTVLARGQATVELVAVPAKE